MNRRAAAPAAALAAAVLSAAGTAAAAPAPQTVGPVVVGWWSAANQDPALPSLTPPDVGPDDLHVAGGNAVAGALPLPGPGGPTAIAALRFSLRAGATAGALTLQLTGTEPPAVTLQACRATSAFDAAQGGAWADAPTYDCADAGTARLEPDGSVVVDGVDALRDGTELSLVLVPGPLDRVVIAPPDESSLAVSGGSSTSTGVPAGAPLPPAAAPFSGTGPLTGGAAPLPAALPSGALPVTLPTAAAAVPPAVATPAPAVNALEVAADRPLPALLATMLLALLAFVLMLRDRGGSPATGTTVVRGVGRFRSERSGEALDLG